jgi:hypothetical protein
MRQIIGARRLSGAYLCGLRCSQQADTSDVFVKPPPVFFLLHLWGLLPRIGNFLNFPYLGAAP